MKPMRIISSLIAFFSFSDGAGTGGRVIVSEITSIRLGLPPLTGPLEELESG
jgi:hypothetical protein